MPICIHFYNGEDKYLIIILTKKKKWPQYYRRKNTSKDFKLRVGARSTNLITLLQEFLLLKQMSLSPLLYLKHTKLNFDQVNEDPSPQKINSPHHSTPLILVSPYSRIGLFSENLPQLKKLYVRFGFSKYCRKKQEQKPLVGPNHKNYSPWNGCCIASRFLRNISSSIAYLQK